MEAVQLLLDAGAELRAAQQAALSSSKGGAERLRTATVARRAAVARLVESASGVLTDAGRSADNQVAAMTGALEVASFEADPGRELATGTMQRVPDAPGGFGEVFGLTAVPDDGEEAATTASSKAKGKAKARAKSPAPDRRELQADVARLRRDRDAAERIVRKARQTADGFARELEGMRSAWRRSRPSTPTPPRKRAPANSTSSVPNATSRRRPPAWTTPPASRY